MSLLAKAMKAWAQLDLSGQSGDPVLIQQWFLEGFANGYEMAQLETWNQEDWDRFKRENYETISLGFKLEEE